ncbi:MAG: 1-acyl-sn-glycerol-3-phosphate acyltransferase [Chloroflexi bacterium]|jgi:1-acyl-sn-glycerol-3-phosphate acyltransferase|nr:1-acyl-sn-glycerol-3-phosphate acyltransferase [Chloroflexota bacterium]
MSVDPGTRRYRSAAEEEAFALPADRLTRMIRVSSAIGRVAFRCFTRVRVEGLEHVPRDGALIIASNHASHADPPLLQSWLPPALGRPIHWMTKAELLEPPVVGWFLKRIGAFGIRRGAADTEAFRLARRVLDEGRVLGAFPEGTRSHDGRMQTAKEGVALLALRTGATVLPVGCAGTHRMWPRGRALWRIGGRVTLRVGPPFHLDRRVLPDGRKETLEEVTERLMLHIAELLPEDHRGVYGAARGAAPGPGADA